MGSVDEGENSAERNVVVSWDAMWVWEFALRVCVLLEVDACVTKGGSLGSRILTAFAWRRSWQRHAVPWNSQRDFATLLREYTTYQGSVDALIENRIEVFSNTLAALSSVDSNLFSKMSRD